MIRDCVKNIIFQALNYDIFRFEDFSIEEKDYSNGTIKISNDEYYYLIHFSAEECRATYSPGVVLTVENDNIQNRRFEMQIVDSLHNWLNRVKRDMLSPLQDRFINQAIQDFRVQLDDKLNEIDNSLFTKEECEELKSRLDMLEEMIEGKENQNEELNSEVKKMKAEIEFLKDSVDKLTKKKWLKNAMLKMWIWSQKPENRKIIEAGVDTVKTISKMDLPSIIE